jgi:hypothetical protein
VEITATWDWLGNEVTGQTAHYDTFGRSEREELWLLTDVAEPFPQPWGVCIYVKYKNKKYNKCGQARHPNGEPEMI